tara:strand:+ start:580 stop:1173 length:594 start_codon:yes stop_codon:yes gene_type:complete
MNLPNDFWYFSGALNDEQCNKILSLKQKNEFKKAVVGEKEQVLKSKRSSNIFWTSEPFIYKCIEPYVEFANKEAGWNFDFDAAEAAQFTEYGKGGYFHWHKDAFSRPWNKPDSPFIHGKIRKLSVTVTLTDPEKYEGGNLEFVQPYPDKENKIFTKEEFRKKGSIIVFPSSVWHRITPITKGTRNSLVIWWLGLPFR